MTIEKIEMCYCSNCQCETSHEVVIIDYYQGKGFYEETWTCNCCGEEN